MLHSSKHGPKCNTCLSLSCYLFTFLLYIVPGEDHAFSIWRIPSMVSIWIITYVFCEGKKRLLHCFWVKKESLLQICFIYSFPVKFWRDFFVWTNGWNMFVSCQCHRVSFLWLLSYKRQNSMTWCAAQV